MLIRKEFHQLIPLLNVNIGERNCQMKYGIAHTVYRIRGSGNWKAERAPNTKHPPNIQSKKAKKRK